MERGAVSPPVMEKQDGVTASLEAENPQADVTCGQVSKWEGKYQVHHRWGCSKNSWIQIYAFKTLIDFLCVLWS